MIIYSTKLNTQTKVKAIYGGITWARITGKFLLGATDNGNTGTDVQSSASAAPGASGGEESHVITVAEMATHNHSSNVVLDVRGVGNVGDSNVVLMSSVTNVTTTIAGGASSRDTVGYGTLNRKMDRYTLKTGITNQGSDNAHNNMPPFLAVYIWERTA